MISRRAILRGALASAAAPRSIDREALVRRHNPLIRKPDPMTPLSVGNGEFAFTADITGLQTFPDFYENAMQLGTESQWGWHSFLNPDGYRLEHTLVCYDSHGRKVCYPEQAGNRASDRAKKASEWLRVNPHRIDLGRIGLLLRTRDGGEARISEIKEPDQTLDLWRGVLESRFLFDGQPVRVLTVCHPERDLIAMRVDSPLVSQQRLGIRVAFPYPAAGWSKAAEWNQPDRHHTRSKIAIHGAVFERKLDETTYYAAARWSPGAAMKPAGPHRYECFAGGAGALEMVIAFAERSAPQDLPDFNATHSAAEAHWRRFWRLGGAIDLSSSADPRAPELERRMVLSQYLTAIQCAGSLPPQETGLVTATAGTGNSISRCTGGTRRTSRCGDDCRCSSEVLAWYESILPMARQRPSVRATTASAGRR